MNTTSWESILRRTCSPRRSMATTPLRSITRDIRGFLSSDEIHAESSSPAKAPAKRPWMIQRSSEELSSIENLNMPAQIVTRPTGLARPTLILLQLQRQRRKVSDAQDKSEQFRSASVVRRDRLTANRLAVTINSLAPEWHQTGLAASGDG